MNKAEIISRLEKIPGKTSFFYKNLVTGEQLLINEEMPMMAASVIKIPIMVECFRQMKAGKLSADQLYVLKNEDKKPSCGALTYMHDGLQVTLMDLITLMIILSDNPATNILIDKLGCESVNDTMRSLNIDGLCLRRRLFEPSLSAQGIQNTVTARGVGTLLARMATNTLLGEAQDAAMISILLDQRLNGKIPFFLHSEGVRCAHKTGEDDGITHDAGIVYARRPFVLVMLSNRVCVPEFEQLIQRTALALWRENR